MSEAAYADAPYFAYGSNTDPTRMVERCPGSQVLGPAYVAGYALAFGGPSRLWQGGVATLQPATGQARVPGILFRVPPATLDALDRIEGHPYFYVRRPLEVSTDNGEVMAFTYLLQDGIPQVPVSPRYLEALLGAYRLHAWDSSALQSLKEGA